MFDITASVGTTRGQGIIRVVVATFFLTFSFATRFLNKINRPQICFIHALYPNNHYSRPTNYMHMCLAIDKHMVIFLQMAMRGKYMLACLYGIL